jgi:hypothetical protein
MGIVSFEQADALLAAIRDWEDDGWDFTVGPDDPDLVNPVSSVACECPACLVDPFDYRGHRDHFFEWQIQQYFDGVWALYIAMLEEQQREWGYGGYGCVHGYDAGDCNVCHSD